MIAIIIPNISCGHVQITDQEWCGDAGSLGGICYHTLTNETRDIPLEEWDDERFGMVCSSAQNFADIKGWIEKLCSVSKKCNYDTKKKIQWIVDRLEALQDAVSKSHGEPRTQSEHMSPELQQSLF